LERIPLPIVKHALIIRGAKPSEVPNAFGTENERKYFVSGGHGKQLYE
jgi:hypothetical protein